MKDKLFNELLESVIEGASLLNKPLFDGVQLAAIELIVKERDRQDVKWGEQNHTPLIYQAILMEEVGETTQAALDEHFGGSKASGLFEEAVQQAAVALAIVECLIRNRGLPQ